MNVPENPRPIDVYQFGQLMDSSKTRLVHLYQLSEKEMLDTARREYMPSFPYPGNASEPGRLAIQSYLNRLALDDFDRYSQQFKAKYDLVFKTRADIYFPDATRWVNFTYVHEFAMKHGLIRDGWFFTLPDQYFYNNNGQWADQIAIMSLKMTRHYLSIIKMYEEYSVRDKVAFIPEVMLKHHLQKVGYDHYTGLERFYDGIRNSTLAQIIGSREFEPKEFWPYCVYRIRGWCTGPDWKPFISNFTVEFSDPQPAAPLA